MFKSFKVDTPQSFPHVTQTTNFNINNSLYKNNSQTNSFD